MPSSLKKRALIAALLLVLALGLYLLLRPAPQLDTAVKAGTEALIATDAAKPAASSVLSPWDLLARASQQAGPALPAVPVLVGEDDESLRRFETQWCAGPGAAIADRLKQGEAGDSALPDRELIGPPLDQLSALLLRRLTPLLRNRGESRAWALADWLAIDDSAPGREAQQRLLAMARGSQDGLVLSLAMQRACSDEACRKQIAERWAQQEPTNLQALLRAQRTPLDDAQLQRLAASASSDDHRAEVFRLLGELETPAHGPLLSSLQTIGLIGHSSGWALPGYGELVRACTAPPVAGPRAGHCAEIAERLWASENGNMVDAAIALRLVAAQPLLYPAWQARRQLHEARLHWMTRPEGLDASMRWMQRTLACTSSTEEERNMRRSLLGNERERLLQEMLAANADIAALSTQYRQTRQRSVLEPTPSR